MFYKSGYDWSMNLFPSVERLVYVSVTEVEISESNYYYLSKLLQDTAVEMCIWTTIGKKTYKHKLCMWSKKHDISF